MGLILSDKKLSSTVEEYMQKTYPKLSKQVIDETIQYHVGVTLTTEEEVREKLISMAEEESSESEMIAYLDSRLTESAAHVEENQFTALSHPFMLKYKKRLLQKYFSAYHKRLNIQDDDDPITCPFKNLVRKRGIALIRRLKSY